MELNINFPLYTNNFNLTPKMNTTPQFQDFPNPNPNLNFEDQFAYTTHHHHHHHHNQLNGSKYFCDIFNYLMSDEDLEELTVDLQSRTTSENTADFFDKFSSSAPFADHNIKRRRKVKIYEAQEELRFAFRTRSDLEVMDDGFKWRKYGKKKVKSSPNPRNYFKCTSEGCSVKKRVERDREDSSYVITTYEGVHNHESPSLNIHISSL